MEIADRRIATVHFTLTDQEGRQITSTRGHAPLTYLHGSRAIVAGLEQALVGKRAGDRFKVRVTPEQGFGPRHDALVQTLPRGMLQDDGEPEVGGKLRAQTAHGPLEVRVIAVDGDSITVDGNHPLAGRPFQAEVEVLEVRLPTPEELQGGLA